MNHQEIYKRAKINRVVITISVMYGVVYIFLIFAYIYQWGNRPIDKTGLIIVTIIFSVALLFLWLYAGRLKIIIDNNYVLFRSGMWVPVRIPIDKIENVSIKHFGLMKTPNFWKNDKTYQFDFEKRAIGIHLKNGKNYYITIQNTQEIKDEIEKRMS